MCIRDRFIGALPFLIKHLGLKTAWHIANTLKKQMNLKVESLSSETFWSRAPIAIGNMNKPENTIAVKSVSYTHLRAHETVLDLVCRLLLEKNK